MVVKVVDDVGRAKEGVTEEDLLPLRLGWTPNVHAGVPSVKVRGFPAEPAVGMTSSEKGTLMIAPPEPPKPGFRVPV